MKTAGRSAPRVAGHYWLTVWALAGSDWAWEVVAAPGRFYRGTALQKAEAWRRAFIVRALLRAVESRTIPAMPERLPWTN